MAELELLKNLEKWYFEHGCKRKPPVGDKDDVAGQYFLPPEDWPNALVHTRRELQAVEEALQHRRPALAIWGPSQGGKSTLFSQFVDRHAIKNPKDSPDLAKNSALHWEKGIPFCFDHYEWERGKSNDRVHLAGSTFNPITSGLDATAVLCRFTAGSVEEDSDVEDYRKVLNPVFPVTALFCDRRDILMFLAAGYVSQVKRANLPNVSIKNWGKAWEPYSGGAPNKDAIELLNDFADVLEVLTQRDEERREGRYFGLRSNFRPSEKFAQNRLCGLFQSKFISSSSLAEQFMFDILWDNNPEINSLYRKLVKLAGDYRGNYSSIRLSFGAASLLVNMSLSMLAYLGTRYDRQNREKKFGAFSVKTMDLMHDLRVNIGSDSTLFVGLGSDFDFCGVSSNETRKLFASGDRFDVEELCLFQSVVLEMIIPLNCSNLDLETAGSGIDSASHPSSLKKLLEKIDLLDFPGFARSKKDPCIDFELEESDEDYAERTILASINSKKDGLEESSFSFCNARLFFELVKRGKTEATFLSYAYRLKIDGMAVVHPINSKQGETSCAHEQAVQGFNYLLSRLGKNKNEEVEIPIFLLLSKAGFPFNNQDGNDGTDIMGSCLRSHTGLYEKFSQHASNGGSVFFYCPHFGTDEWNLSEGFRDAYCWTDSLGIAHRLIERWCPEILAERGLFGPIGVSIAAMFFNCNSKEGVRRVDTGVLYGVRDTDSVFKAKQQQNQASRMGDGGVGYIFAAFLDRLERAEIDGKPLRVKLLEEKQRGLVAVLKEGLLSYSALVPQNIPMVQSWEDPVKALQAELLAFSNALMHYDLKVTDIALEGQKRERRDPVKLIRETICFLQWYFSVDPEADLDDPAETNFLNPAWVARQFRDKWSLARSGRCPPIPAFLDKEEEKCSLQSLMDRRGDFLRNLAVPVAKLPVIQELAERLSGRLQSSERRVGGQPDLRRILAVWMSKEILGDEIFGYDFPMQAGQMDLALARGHANSFFTLLNKRLDYHLNADKDQIAQLKKQVNLGLPTLFGVLENPLYGATIPDEIKDRMQNLRAQGVVGDTTNGDSTATNASSTQVKS